VLCVGCHFLGEDQGVYRGSEEDVACVALNVKGKLWDTLYRSATELRGWSRDLSCLPRNDLRKMCVLAR